MKHIRSLLFCLLIVIVIFRSLPAKDAFEIADTLDLGKTAEAGVLNPKWEYYNSLSEEEKAEWQAAPEKYVVPSDGNSSDDYNVKMKAYAPIAYSASLPAKYDLRTLNAVTPVENQGNLSICWAFASNESLESNMIMHKQGTFDFSERQLDYISAKNNTIYREGFNPYASVNSRNIGEGGTFNSAVRYLAMGLGAVQMTGTWSSWNENKFAVNLSDAFNLNNSNYLVTDYIRFPDLQRKSSATEKEQWRKNIKNHIMQNGAVYISTLSPEKAAAHGCYVDQRSGDISGLLNWNDSCESPFASPTYKGTHAMAIIGWDDNYSLSYCSYSNGDTNTSTSSTSCYAAGGKYNVVNGAWILKNSWGDLTQYIYLAYDSDYLEAAGIIKVVPKDYDNTYNTYGPVSITNVTGHKVEALFQKARPIETLKRVSFETSTTQDVTYSVYYGDKNTKTLLGTVKVNTPGRYSVEANNVSLTQEDFIIYVEPSIGNAYTQPSKVFAFTNNTQTDSSATTYFETSSGKWQSDGTYKYNIKSRATNLVTGTKLSFIIKDVYNNTIVNYTDDSSYLVAGAYEGVIVLPNKLADNSIYYIETYANGSLIGKNSFATGMALGSVYKSGKLYYVLKNEADLKYMTTLQYKFSNYILNNDITLTSNNFEPLGRNTADQFRGTLDGNNHTIYNLQENNTNTGLFFKIEANISDLKIKNSNLTSTGSTSGVLASQSYHSTIKNVLTEGMINSTNENGYIGGIVGYADDTDFVNVVNETSLAGGKSGEITGYLGSYSTITNALNQGLISGNKSAMSTFFHSSALTSNKIEQLVDLAVENNASCSTPYSGLSSSQLTYHNVIYASDNSCNYIGTRVSKNSLKSSSTYSSFGYEWGTSNGLPYIKDNQVIYITDFTPIGAKNLFIGVNSIMEISTTPSNATYKGVTLKSNNENIVRVINGNQLQGVSTGEAKVTVTTGDGTYITKEATVYVLDDALKQRFSNGYLFIPENSTPSSLSNGQYTVTASSNNIGTGTTLTYKLGEQIVGSFVGVVKGDLNGNGKIQADDVLLMKRHILRLDNSNPLTAVQLKAGDITGTGISAIGILKMQRHILRLDGGGEL